MDPIVKDFLRNILTDQIDLYQIKTMALELYVKDSIENIGLTDTSKYLTFELPGSTNVLYITQEKLDMARRECDACRKISAIKIIRAYGYLNGYKNEHPGLKESIDFVEKEFTS